VLIDKANQKLRKSSNQAEGPSPAAAYVRMSTDHQKYSTENQLDTIRRYAEQRGYGMAANPSGARSAI
jgi:hypothetical protein